MYKMLLLIVVICLFPTLCFGAALTETGDARAKPMSMYGVTSGGALVAVQVDSDGALVMDTSMDDLTINNKLSVNDIEVTGTFTSNGTGQSTFNEGLIVNESSGGAATDDFRAETNNFANALVVDASADEIIIGTDLSVKDSLTISQGGLVVAGGNVGIGTASPSKALDVASTGLDGIEITAGTPTIWLDRTSGTDGYILYDGNYYFNQGSDVVRIDTVGDVRLSQSMTLTEGKIIWLNSTCGIRAGGAGDIEKTEDGGNSWVDF